MEMRAHSLAASLSAGLQAPTFVGQTPPSLPPFLPHRFKEWKFFVALRPLTQLIYWKESGCNWKRYQNMELCSVQKNNVGYTSHVFIERSFVILCTIYRFKEIVPRVPII